MSETYEKRLTVVTPEQVQLQFQTAGLGSRALAHLIDMLILTVVNAAVVLLLFGASRALRGTMSSSALETGAAFAILAVLLLNIGYFICTEAFMGGQTPGKRLFGLRVLQNNGQSATMLSIIIRNLFRLLDFLPMFYFIGALVMLFSPRDKRTGDMVAGTIVVLELQRERAKRRKSLDKAIAPWHHRLPALERNEFAEQRISTEDWQLLSAWIERIPGMHIARLEALSVPIARHFAAKLQHDAALSADTAAYLIALYELLREDWEV